VEVTSKVAATEDIDPTKCTRVPNHGVVLVLIIFQLERKTLSLPLCSSHAFDDSH
jgi:hypothetical protein